LASLPQPVNTNPLRLRPNKTGDLGAGGGDGLPDRLAVAWPLDGLPNSVPRKRVIFSKTPGASGVVAL